MSGTDAVIVGAGPNGLAAAVTLARAGLGVTVFERGPVIGGGARTAETTLPGFLHDVCSAVHPMAFASPFFQQFGLSERIPFVVPELSYAQPLDGGRAGLAYRDIDATAEALGRDGAAWRSIFAPLVARQQALAEVTGSALVRAVEHPIVTALFGLRALEQGSPAWNLRWREDIAPALLSGVMTHAVQPMPTLGSAATGLALATYAHGEGWPIPIGGSRSIVDALAADLLAHGGRIETSTEVTAIDELPRHRVALFDTSARGMVRIARRRFPTRYADRIRRVRFGNAAAKVDFALSDPVPWRRPELAGAGTFHIGGTRAELARSERDVARGRHPVDPYVLASQPTAFDPTRAPEGRHVLWAYTHVPAGSTADPTEAIIRQVERFAPGFRDTILASTSSSAADIEVYNPNYVDGDIASGAGDFGQLLARPVVSWTPWRTPAKGVYLASASASPGPGVHGMAGWHAALTALRDEFGMTTAPSLAPERS
ncbi:NAD(P)/FAD-dependent oxidoreductase [Herbiconiux sp. L3-i23]|uniref:phytoene desaturase family protein n=1 Tax=Herbiconiux sp. L3-i23 TaxID=2905871 RepID=UPI0020624ABE|nr:NAD(P)/FAD-dependent oxidoreductase [Herbiconiux sp. L3-i23]BDI21953.1 phytoene dehydrogenase [Herbiconiux sp. L3-i23]